MADTDSASALPSGTASPKEDAATKSAREELKHTVISEKADADDSEARAVTPENTPQLKPGQHDALKEQVSSPKKKRAHDQVDDDDDNTAAEGNKKNKDDHDKSADEADAAETAAAATTAPPPTDAPDSAEPDKKRLRDETAGDANGAKDATTAGKDAKAAPAPAPAFASSGFAKLTSTASPFGALGGAGAAAKPLLFGSSSAVAAAPSSASPFGSFGASAAKPATAAPSAAPAVTSPTLSFGGSGAASPFAGLQNAASSKGFGSAFGSIGGAGGGFGGAAGGFGGAGAPSAFGSALPGPTLTSFAKPGEAFKSAKPARPFGAPESEPEESGDEDSAAEEDENGDEGEGDEEGAEAEEKTKASGEEKKKRLQRVVTDDGETGEATLLQVRARMYYHDKDLGWKERGAGMLKVNVPEQCVEYDRDGSVIPASFDASTLGAVGDGGADDDDADDAGSDDANGSKSDAGAAAKTKPASGLAAVPQRTMVRLIMRQDSTHRVILNTVVVASTEFKDRQTLKATTVLFTAFEGEEAKPVTVQAKMNIANAKTFLSVMEGIQKELRGD